MREATITARINHESKVKAEKILKKLGLTHSSAINLFYNQILLNDGLPFEIKIPESMTTYTQATVIAEPETVYNSIEEVFENIDNFPENIKKLLQSFGKSKKTKEMITKLAVEHFIDEIEFVMEAERRLNDESDELISEEEFKKEFNL